MKFLLLVLVFVGLALAQEVGVKYVSLEEVKECQRDTQDIVNVTCIEGCVKNNVFLYAYVDGAPCKIGQYTIGKCAAHKFFRHDELRHPRYTPICRPLDYDGLYETDPDTGVKIDVIL